MELKIATRTVTDEGGKQRKFNYSLLIDEIETGHFICEDYGVLIREEDGQSASVPNITTSAQRIDELMELLVENRVGPATLADVVADWL